MKIPRGATSYTQAPRTILCGEFLGKSHRHTVRPKGTEDWLVIYTLRGFGLFGHEEGYHRVGAHEITLYRPGVFQNYRRDSGAPCWDILYAHFLARPEWPEWLEWPELAPGLFHLRLEDTGLRRRMVKRLQDMLRLNRRGETRHEALAANALEEVLLWCDSVNPRRAHLGVDPRVRRVMDHLIEHCEEPFSPERMAKISGLSASRLRHVFRQQVGMAPRDFQEHQRLRKARELLCLSSLTIGEISRLLGFESPFYFSLRFKKQVGENPRAFRQRELAGQAEEPVTGRRRKG